MINNIAAPLKHLHDRHMAKSAPTDLSSYLGGRDWDAVWDEYERQGYVIFERLLDAQTLTNIRAALEPHFTKTGRNDFEGFRSHRIYALLDKAPDVLGPLVTHPLAMAFVEAELGRSALLSALIAIQLLPGETKQDWHCDDEQITVPRPRPAYGVSAFWAIDETTPENGATHLLPQSHLWGPDEPRPAVDDPRTITAAMPAGSLLLTKGTLFHRGGANQTEASRLILASQYCPGWARPLETMLLAVSRDKAAKMPTRLRELLGYNLHEAFMGYVDGRHPDRKLGL